MGMTSRYEAGSVVSLKNLIVAKDQPQTRVATLESGGKIARKEEQRRERIATGERLGDTSGQLEHRKSAGDRRVRHGDAGSALGVATPERVPSKQRGEINGHR